MTTKLLQTQWKIPIQILNLKKFEFCVKCTVANPGDHRGHGFPDPDQQPKNFPKIDNFRHSNNEYLKHFLLHFAQHEFLNIQDCVFLLCTIIIKFFPVHLETML